MTKKALKRALVGLLLAFWAAAIPITLPAPCVAGSATNKVQVLKDKQGRVMGKVKTLPNGKRELRDKQGRVMGRYDAKSDKTKDKQGRVVGKGNLLPMLIQR